MSWKLTGDFCVMKMENDAKFDEELTCQFKIDMRNCDRSTRIWTRALENLKNLHFNRFLFNKVYNNVWAEKIIGELCLMVLNIDAAFCVDIWCGYFDATFRWCGYFWGPWVSFFTADEFSVRVTKINSRIGVSWTHSPPFCF